MKNEAPLVTIIVTHHLDENAEYLRLCLMAVGRTEGVPFETIVVSDGVTCPDVPDTMTLVHDRALDSVSKKIHRAIALSDKRSKYFLIVSDDVMISKHLAAGMASAIGDQRLISIPMSNGDNGSQFATHIELVRENSQTMTVPLHMDAKDIAGWEEEVINFPIGRPLLVPVRYVCFFCPMIPRAVWDEVGDMNPVLDVRHNDEEYCYRARAKGIASVIDFGVFALHFGSKTLNKVAPEETRNEASKAFYSSQWGGRQ